MTIKIEPYLDPQLQFKVDELEKLIQRLFDRYQHDKDLNVLDIFDNGDYILYTNQMEQIFQKFTKIRMVLA